MLATLRKRNVVTIPEFARLGLRRTLEWNGLNGTYSRVGYPLANRLINARAAWTRNNSEDSLEHGFLQGDVQPRARNYPWTPRGKLHPAFDQETQQSHPEFGLEERALVKVNQLRQDEATQLRLLTKQLRKERRHATAESRRERKFERRRMKEDHKDRIRGWFNQIVGVGASKRRFPGTVKIEDNKASIAQAQLHERQLPSERTEAVFWVDGSVFNQKLTRGVMDAAVVYFEKDSKNWIEKGYRLGKNVGEANDEELFAVAAALEIAVENAHSSCRAPVVIYSDSKENLIALRDSRPCALGPLISPRWALEDILDRAEALKKVGIDVELRWVKGHAGSIGNMVADRTSEMAVHHQARESKTPTNQPATAIPDALQGLGRAVLEEFRYRSLRDCMAGRYSYHKQVAIEIIDMVNAWVIFGYLKRSYSLVAIATE